MDQNASSDLDSGTLDGGSSPSLAPAILELDCEVSFCQALDSLFGSTARSHQFWESVDPSFRKYCVGNTPLCFLNWLSMLW
jgi:hypothetical protein